MRIVYGLILVYGVIGTVILIFSLAGSVSTSALLFAPPTATQAPPTATQAPPTATQAPPTATQAPPTATQAPPTATQAPPTATEVPPTATEVPPTATEVPPTAVPTKTKIPPTVKPTVDTAKSVCYAKVQDWANDTGYMMLSVWASFKAFENSDLVKYGEYLYKAKLEYDTITAPSCDSDVILAHGLIGTMLEDMASTFFAINDGRVYDAAVDLKNANSTLKRVTQIINALKVKYDIK